MARPFGQYCGFARALEVVGERWALLVVRDLLVGPRRFGDLQRGLASIPSNVLATRLRELEASGIVRRAVRPRPLRGVAYELTEDGRGLEDAVVALGRWGARRLGEPRPGEIVTPDSIAMALRTIFRPGAAAGDDVAFELRLGEIVLGARVRDGKLDVVEGALDAPDLVVESGPGIRKLFAGEISPTAAVKSGLVRLRGNRALLGRFAQIFRI